MFCFCCPRHFQAVFLHTIQAKSGCNLHQRCKDGEIARDFVLDLTLQAKKLIGSAAWLSCPHPVTSEKNGTKGGGLK